MTLQEQINSLAKAIARKTNFNAQETDTERTQRQVEDIQAQQTITDLDIADIISEQTITDLDLRILELEVGV